MWYPDAPRLPPSRRTFVRVGRVEKRPRVADTYVLLDALRRAA